MQIRIKAINSSLACLNVRDLQPITNRFEHSTSDLILRKMSGVESMDIVPPETPGPSLKNKRALVIGGGGEIGRAIVRKLLEMNVEVTCLIVNSAAQHDFVTEFPDVKVSVNDITDWKKTEALVKMMKRFDYVANAAGVDQFDDLVDVTEEIYNKVMSVNVDAAFNICRTVADEVVKARGKKENFSLSIVNVSSVASFKAYRSVSCVCVSKGSLDQMARSFAIEYGKHNIRMNNVNPSTVSSEKAKETLEKISKRDGPTISDLKEESLKKIPLGRLCKPDNVADAVLFLLSNFSKMISGTTLIVDGGIDAYVN